MSQCDRVLAVLQDGRPHSFHELLREVPCIVHSRISELRSRGHLIECHRRNGDYLYVLVGTLREEAVGLEQTAASSLSVPTGDLSPPGPASREDAAEDVSDQRECVFTGAGPGQLSFEVAA